MTEIKALQPGVVVKSYHFICLRTVTFQGKRSLYTDPNRNGMTMLCNSFSRSDFSDRTGWMHQDRVNYSELTNLEYAGYQAPTCSIKYVLTGAEHYFFNDRKFSVGAGKFLLVNGYQTVDVMIRSKNKVQGFCVHINANTMGAVYRDLTCSESELLDDPFNNESLPGFGELVYAHQENQLGEMLQQMAARFDRSTNSIDIDGPPLFYNLARQMFLLQQGTKFSERRLGVLRNSTHQELARRLAIAREMLDGATENEADINSIARAAMLSTSHLFRSFKKMYGISPYQYHLRKRLQYGAQLLKNNNRMVKDVAFDCGFPDVASFSKAFKKHFRKSPVQFCATVKPAAGGDARY
jgi:AraC family transcriptional regulator